MKPIITLSLAALTLAGCATALDLVNQGRPYAAEVAKELVLAECALPISERAENAKAVEAKLVEAGSNAKFLLDCTGDGKADF